MPNPFRKARDFWEKARDYAHEHDLAAKLEPVATTVGFLIVLTLVGLGIYVIAVVPHIVIQRSMDAALSADRAKQLELEDTYRKTLTQIVLGVFGLFLLYFTWRRSVAGDKTVRIAEQGHITDRFTKAIEQLGKTDGTTPNIEVRLGAIYALERIALDSPRDHWTIMEVLTAYVRQNAPLRPDVPYTEGEKPRTDIQAILTVLGRRKLGLDRERPEHALDLSCSRLCGVDLPKVNLQLANLIDANLQQANLWEANLQKANFWKANMQHALLWNAKLQQANLREANLQHTNLREANLQYASLSEADLRWASLWNANLQHANLREADLQQADLGQANLQQADLIKANLQGASLWTANLLEASIVDANLLEVRSVLPIDIQSAEGWEYAHYSPAFRTKLGLPPEPMQDPPTPSIP